MKNNSTFKQYANRAKSRMLRSTSFPSIVGKIPYNKYEAMMKYVDNNELLFKICFLVENDIDISNPISRLIDKNEFAKLSPEIQQRMVFKIANAFSYVKKLYAEMEEKNTMDIRA